MALTEQEILAGLAEIIDEIAGVPADEVTPDKNFVDDLDIDSLSMVEIAVAAQDKFGVEIPDDQLKDLKTVQDVITYVHKNASYRHGACSPALALAARLPRRRAAFPARRTASRGRTARAHSHPACGPRVTRLRSRSQ